MEDKNFADLGSRISDAVQSAVNTGDFSYLKQTISGTVNTVLEKTMKRDGTYTPPPPPPPVYNTYASPSYAREKPAYVKLSAKKRGIGILLLVLGVIGTVYFGFSLLIVFTAGILTAMQLYPFLLIMLVLVLLCGGCVFMLVKGARKYGYANRYRQYCRLLDGKVLCEIQKMSETVGKNIHFVVKDVQKMIKEDWFVNGHLDREQTCLMIGEETYQQYLRAQEQMEQRRQEEEEIRNNPDSLAAVVAEGKDCIERVHEVNVDLPGEDISVRLDRLEEVTSKIFSYVEKHPLKLPEIRRFMNYYLPTTLKIVNSYHEMELHPIPGADNFSLKREILEILDTINTAFEALLDSLFKDDALDLSTDMAALKTILAQEGLTK